nr:hypothetical protein [Mesorhizobium sp.]
MTNAHRPDLTPAQQFIFLRTNPVCRGAGRIGAAGLRWVYPDRPTPLSREYLVQLTYAREGTPKVTILRPDLQLLAGDRKLPHVYRDPLRLCLYLPRAGEWKGSMRLDQTFIPWTTTWLYYFEEWLASDDWKGGGEHPSNEDDEGQPRRIRGMTI